MHTSGLLRSEVLVHVFSIMFRYRRRKPYITFLKNVCLAHIIYIPTHYTHYRTYSIGIYKISGTSVRIDDIMCFKGGRSMSRYQALYYRM